MEHQNIFLILIAVGFVITIPYAYSAVEPSIIINMESGQTTKPFQVKDSLGAVIFSVDVDGTIFPAPPSSAVTTVESLRHILIGEDSNVASIPQDVSSQKVLAKWRVDFNSPQIDNAGFAGLPPVIVTHFFFSNFIKSTGGTFIIATIGESFDDTTFSEFATNGEGTTLYQGTFFGDVNDQKICIRSNISENQCFITFGYFVDGIDTGFLRDALFELGIILPADTTITKLI